MGGRRTRNHASAAELPRLRAELTALSTEVQRLRALVAAVPDLIIRLHRDGNVPSILWGQSIQCADPRSGGLADMCATCCPKKWQMRTCWRNGGAKHFADPDVSLSAADWRQDRALRSAGGAERSG